MHELSFILCHYSRLFQQAQSNFSAQTTFLPVLLDRCGLYSVGARSWPCTAKSPSTPAQSALQNPGSFELELPA